MKIVSKEIAKLETEEIQEILKTTSQTIQDMYKDPKISLPEMEEALRFSDILIQAGRLELSIRLFDGIIDGSLGFIAKEHTVGEYAEFLCHLKDALESIRILSTEEKKG